MKDFLHEEDNRIVVDSFASSLFSVALIIGKQSIVAHRNTKKLMLYTESIEIRQNLKTEGKLLDENNLADAFMNRGLAYQDIQDIQKAIDDYNFAIEIQQNLKAEGKLLDENNLARAFDNRCTAYLILKDLDSAIKDSNKANELKENLSSYNLACAYALKTEIDTAFKWLENNLQSEYKVKKEQIEKDTDLLNIHYDKRWNELLEKYS